MVFRRAKKNLEHSACTVRAKVAMAGVRSIDQASELPRAVHKQQAGSGYENLSMALKPSDAV